MRRKTTKAVITAAALVFGAMPIASAQTNTETNAVPYTITFDGSFYPDALETIEYPYLAASLNRSGECSLKIKSDESQNIAEISVTSCSDDLFEAAAQRFAAQQIVDATASSDLAEHTLSIKWSIGAEVANAPIQVASSGL